MTKPIEIEAHCFTLRGTNGRKLAMLTTNDDDEAYLCFLDHTGKGRIALGFTKQRECRLTFLDEDGVERVGLSFLPNGQASMLVNGGPGKPSVGMRGGWDEGCGIGAWSGAGNLRTHVGISGDGMPNVMVLNSDGRVIWRCVKDDGTITTPGGIVMPKPPPAPPPPVLG